jgi:hypothetical protein
MILLPFQFLIILVPDDLAFIKPVDRLILPIHAELVQGTAFMFSISSMNGYNAIS